MHLAAVLFAALLQTIDLSAWSGETFVLLPKPAKAQQYGYRSFDPALPYAEWVGKQLKVKSVEAGEPATIVFVAPDGSLLHAEAYNGTVHDIASVRELDEARQQYAGKTLTLRVAQLLTTQHAIDVGKGTRVKVKEIVAGDLDYEPFRFVLTTPDGREGFLDVQLTGTNVSPKLRGIDTFSQLFGGPD